MSDRRSPATISSTLVAAPAAAASMEMMVNAAPPPRMRATAACTLATQAGCTNAARQPVASSWYSASSSVHSGFSVVDRAPTSAMALNMVK